MNRTLTIPRTFFPGQLHAWSSAGVGASKAKQCRALTEAEFSTLMHQLEIMESHKKTGIGLIANLCSSNK